MDSIKSLPAYIALLGDEAFASRYGVKPRTAASWRRRERFPRLDQAHELVAKSNGELTIAMVYAQEAA